MRFSNVLSVYFPIKFLNLVGFFQKIMIYKYKIDILNIEKI